MNSVVFDAINDLAGHSAIADDLGKWAAGYLLYAIVLVVAGMWFLGRSREERGANRRLVLEAVFSALVGLVVITVIQRFYHHPRPFANRGDVYLLIPHTADPSFPSEHVTVAAALAGSMIWNRRWIGAPLILAALALGFARVFAGIHYPADVAAAFALGLGVSCIVAQMKAPADWAQRTATRCMPPPLR